MSINWAMPNVGVRVVDRRPARVRMPLALDDGWVFRPFQPPAGPHPPRQSDPSTEPDARRTVAELTESPRNRTIAAG
jgi:hypothetical protein